MITEKLLAAIFACFSFLGALMWILEISFCCCVNWAHFAPNVYDVPFSSCCFFLAKPSFISCLCSFLLFTFGGIFFIDPNPLVSLWILCHTTNKQTTTWRPKIPSNSSMMFGVVNLAHLCLHPCPGLYWTNCAYPPHFGNVVNLAFGFSCWSLSWANVTSNTFNNLRADSQA